VVWPGGTAVRAQPWVRGRVMEPWLTAVLQTRQRNAASRGSGARRVRGRRAAARCRVAVCAQRKGDALSREKNRRQGMVKNRPVLQAAEGIVVAGSKDGRAEGAGDGERRLVGSVTNVQPP